MTDTLIAGLFDVYAVDPACRCCWERITGQLRYHIIAWSRACPVHGRPGSAIASAFECGGSDG